MAKTILFLILLVCTACNNKLENDIEGLWEIESAYYHNKPIIYDLMSNGIYFEDNNICHLPVRDIQGKKLGNNKGTWKISENNNLQVLLIETQNPLFNRNFIISKFEKANDSKTAIPYIQMTIVSDSLKLNCIKKVFVE